jgi:hypothetical protein
MGEVACFHGTGRAGFGDGNDRQLSSAGEPYRQLLTHRRWCVVAALSYECGRSLTYTSTMWSRLGAAAWRRRTR